MDFWLKKPSILWENENICNIYPKEDLPMIEKLNAVARFAIAYAVLIILFDGDKKWLAVSVTLLLLTIVFYRTDERFTEDKQCTAPTNNNPYMNFTVGDYYDNVDKPAACDTLDPKISNKVDEIVNMHHKDRGYANWSFYTLPVTRAINDQTAFAKFLFGTSGECKHDGKNCLINRDIRYNKGRLINLE